MTTCNTISSCISAKNVIFIILEDLRVSCQIFGYLKLITTLQVSKKLSKYILSRKKVHGNSIHSFYLNIPFLEVEWKASFPSVSIYPQSSPPTQILLTFQEFVFCNLHHLSCGIQTVTLMAASHQIGHDKEESKSLLEFQNSLVLQELDTGHSTSTRLVSELCPSLLLISSISLCGVI